MNILIAGATGTLGLPLVRTLAARGDEVAGLTRTQEKQTLLEQAGATPLVADALDAQALEKAIQSAKPDCVVDLLTAIPKQGPTRAAHMQATNVLRVQGTRNLLKASIAAGAQRIVAESMVFAYGFGDHGPTVKSEAGPMQVRESTPWLQEIVDAIRSLEEQLLSAGRQGLIDAIPLRYGLFYGPQSPATETMIESVKQRRLPLISGAHGSLPWIHVEDALQATLSAIEHGRPGEIYNIVDDHPVSFNDMVAYMAELTEVKRPFSLPLGLVRVLMPYVGAFTTTRLHASNQKARRDLDWQPRYPSFREGLRQTVAELEA